MAGNVVAVNFLVLSECAYIKCNCTEKLAQGKCQEAFVLFHVKQIGGKSVTKVVLILYVSTIS